MNFNKCKRCGCFFVANGDTCPVCTKKDNSDISTLNSYFAENENTHSISINNLANITGIEVQAEVADMANRSIMLNNLENKFNIINCNIKNILDNVERESFDVVVTNPPYKKNNTGGKNENEKKLISRHEILADINDFIKTAKIVLKDKGTLYMVHRPERLSDIIYSLRENKIEPKKIRFVYSKNDSKNAKLVLIKAVKNGGDFLEIENPLYIYRENGEYSDEIINIYNNNN